mmetsp:Transcript_866/g.1908  ORF Transcript_866/g.1908 Transcript_866/m.1908 type:complete len:241 (+) Transcript_866:335-1057(+)
MLATECSKPMQTNIGMQDQMPRILPGMSAEAVARKIARDTSQLHKTALMNVGSSALEHFFTAVALIRSAMPPFNRPASFTSNDIVVQPSVFPNPATANARRSSRVVILPSYHAAVQIAKLPVISCPAAIRMKISPMGKISPMTKRCKSGPMPGRAPATTRENTPPIATNIPPMKDWCSAFSSGACAFDVPFSTSAWYVSAGSLVGVTADPPRNRITLGFGVAEPGRRAEAACVAARRRRS